MKTSQDAAFLKKLLFVGSDLAAWADGVPTVWDLQTLKCRIKDDVFLLFFFFLSKWVTVASFVADDQE